MCRRGQSTGPGSDEVWVEVPNEILPNTRTRSSTSSTSAQIWDSPTVALDAFTVPTLAAAAINGLPANF